MPLFLLLFLSVILGVPTPDARSAQPDPSSLAAMAVMHEGRLKPMETFARHVLLQFSGRSSYRDSAVGKQSALQTVSQLLFVPEKVRDYRLFLINNPEVVQSLGIPAQKRRRYSFRQLESTFTKLQESADRALEMEDEKRSLVDKEILRVHGNLSLYVALSKTFSFAIPNPLYGVSSEDTKAKLRLPREQTMFSFWDLMGSARHIADVLGGVGARTESDRTPMEKEVILLSQAMYFGSQSVAASPLRILPVSAPDVAASSGTDWIGPSEAINAPAHMQSLGGELQFLAEMTAAYRSGDTATFAAEATKFIGAVSERAYAPMKGTRFPLELAYQKLDPFGNALILYWAALLSCFLMFLLRNPWFRRVSLALLLAGYALHLFGIVSRTIIMHRPPVTSLYETFPFVSAVCIFAALAIERVYSRVKSAAGMGLLAASALGVVLLSIAGRYAAEGDTMKVLVAVLDSNFWLSTHVICISIGYSACILAGAIGHIWVVMALLPKRANTKERLASLERMVFGTLCFGLLFSFIGTVLGGIWADQSWGRFWGWDPKENGALLIVIWCIILIHAKYWGYIKAGGLAMGAVFGSIVVALAWFGVNLLNVGLHSYGFTSGAATKLFAYIGMELLFIAIGSAWLGFKPPLPTSSPRTLVETD